MYDAKGIVSFTFAPHDLAYARDQFGKHADAPGTYHATLCAMTDRGKIAETILAYGNRQ